MMKRPFTSPYTAQSPVRLRKLLLSAALLIALSATPSLLIVNGSKPLIAAADATVGSRLVSDNRQCQMQVWTTPSALHITPSSPPLNIQIDQPANYTVYGTSMRQIASQIAHCAPHASGSDSAEYTAKTSYHMSWTYDIISSGGYCTVSGAKVGLHITRTLPDWQPMPGEPTPLVNRWVSFITALQAHEAGHAAIDKRYAAGLLSDLQNFPAADCTDFQSRIDHLTQQDIAKLNQANDNYDSDTAHGATQGAVMPQ